MGQLLRQKKFPRKLCLQNPDNSVLQKDYKAQCKFVRNLINQKLRNFCQNKIEKEAANSKRSFFNLFKETSGKTLPAHHNKHIVENIETLNTFFANIGVELAKTFDTKQRYENETNINTMFCFPITSSEDIDTLQALPSKFSLDCHKINNFFSKKFLGQLVHYLKHYIMNVWSTDYSHSAWK